MPRYSYYCINCEKTMEIYHSMLKKIIDCPMCNCSGSLEKRMDGLCCNILSNDKNNVGKVVDSFIKESKEELKDNIEELRKNR